ncbi:MAG: hypothetical protein IJV39_05190 [Ruminococcus sp.]|nr:hypothetical protein [Ruminococcus sp.]
MELYDLHCHILPEMDDGSESVEMSVKMLNTLAEQGVRHICFTPHYYTHKESMEDFLERRQSCYEILKPHIPEGIEVCLGAEVYVTDIIMNNKSLKPVCYGNSNYILLEFPYNTSFEGTSYDFLMRLINLYNVRPVMAHIERYDAMIRNPKLLEDLSGYGIKFQTNANSYLERSTFRKFKKLIKYGLIHYIGSDAHNLQRYQPDRYKEAFDLIAKKTSPDVVNGIIHYSKKVFDAATN